MKLLHSLFGEWGEDIMVSREKPALAGLAMSNLTYVMFEDTVILRRVGQ